MKPIGRQRVTASAASNHKTSKVDKGPITKPGLCYSKAGARKQKASDKANFVHLTGGASTSTFLKPPMPRNNEKKRACFNLSYPCPELPLHPENHSGTGLCKDATESPIIKQAIPLKHGPKLAIQFFPINNITRNGMEEGQFNPHLELVVAMKKKISSVIKHLNSKWGNSSVASGELVLFPIGAQIGNLSNFKRWTVEDTGVTVGDIYTDLGSPSIFRLRYGWFSDINECNKENQNICTRENQNVFKNNLEKEDGINVLLSELTNISFSELLAGVSSNKQCLFMEGGSCLPFCSDSFDAAIASHMARFKIPSSSISLPNASILDAEETCQAFSFQKNIISAKETLASRGSDNANQESVLDSRPALSNQEPLSDRISKLANGQPLSDSDRDVSKTIGYVNSEADEAKPDTSSTEQDPSCQGSQPPSEGLVTVNENSLGLFGINWDSLGPLDYGISLCSTWKQMIGDESVNLSKLFGIGSNQDASLSNITNLLSSGHSRDAVGMRT